MFHTEKLYLATSAPVAVAAVAREIRVRAIQTIMGGRGLMRRHDPKRGIDSLDHRQKELARIVPYGRFKDYRAAEDWALDLQEKTLRRWSLDRIRHVWRQRIDVIRNWMETKVA